MKDNPQSPSGVPRFRDVAPALEFCTWVVVALAPMLYFVNGPPVTDDQAVGQIALTAIAAIAAVALRIYNWRVIKKADPACQSQRE